MIYTKLADIAEVVAAAGLDVDALSLIVTEALDEDLGGRSDSILHAPKGFEFPVP